MRVLAGIGAKVRDEFRAIVSGWTLTSGVEDLGEYIEEAARFTEAHGPLMPSEERTVRMMIECQVARGIKRGDFAPFIVASEPGYLLVEGGPHDVEHRYCGACHKFHEGSNHHER